MNLFTADLSTVSFDDLEGFLAVKGPEEHRPSEGVKIDYKLHEPSDFPETVAAFANTAGGLVFIGVDSEKLKNNVPVALPGEAFAGGDVKARVTGKIMSQVTPRPEISVGIVPVQGTPGLAIALVRVQEGSWPPYEFRQGDKSRIPIRIEDTVRQATLREIEQLFSKRQSYAENTNQRVAGAFGDETKPLVPRYTVVPGQSVIPTYGYQTWITRPRQELHVRLDREFERVTRLGIASHFKSMMPGDFYAPDVNANSHLFKWQGRAVGGESLTYVRYFEITSEGSIRFCEKIDRHDNRIESVSDLYIGSLQFLDFAASFYRSHDYYGSLSAVQRIDCNSNGISLSPTFPDIDGYFSHTAAIAFGDQTCGNANGSSRVVREIDSFEAEDRIQVVHEFMLAHLRQQCRASIESTELMPLLRNLPERAPIPQV